MCKQMININVFLSNTNNAIYHIFKSYMNNLQIIVCFRITNNNNPPKND